MTEREDWVQAMVAAGLGCTLMPQFLPIIDGVLLRPVIEPEVWRQISIVTVAGRPHNKAVSLAIKTASSLAWDVERSELPSSGRVTSSTARP
jgi:LysR family transcriptional regulator, hydrogen peroxide-inducible genes activator